MIRTARIGALLVLAGALAACGTGDDPDEALEERIAALEADLGEARGEADDLRTENERLEAELAALRDDDPEPPDEPDETPPDVGTPQPERTAEGLNEQLRLLFGVEDLPEGFEPGTTDWSGREQPPGLEDSYPTPGALAFDLAAALDSGTLGSDQWETTARVLLDADDPDQAYVAVLSWGFLDDAVAGRDLRMTITRSDAGWEPGGVEERHHCRRSVAEDEQLCV